MSSSTTFHPSESLRQRLKKAAHVAPSPAQLKWMEREYIAFLHYSPNTFTNRQWGNGTETLADFAPDAQDVAQWARMCRESGMRMIIPTLKHHDGFCQWHSDATDFAVQNCPVPEDIARSLSDACHKEGIDFGVYLSPWDMHERGKGVWPTSAYQELYLKQLRELMTRYGDIGELWLDGACGDLPIWQPVDCYDAEAWYDVMEKEQPLCVTRRYDPFEYVTEEEWQALQEGRGELKWRGKAVRWVGNEDGIGRTDEWSVQPVFHRTHSSEATLPDLGEEHYYEKSVGAVWYPNEVNTHVLNQWFWNEETSYPRSLEEMINIFYHSIGNNGLLLLNVSPDRHGVIPEDQIIRLQELKTFMDGTFSVDLAQGASVNASSEATPANAIFSADSLTYWMPASEDWDLDEDTATLEITLPKAQTFDNLLLQEAIRHGQRVAHWQAEAFVNGEWKLLADKKTIGYKTIVRFPAVTTDRIRITILRSWDTPMISRMSLHMTCMPETQDLNPRRIYDIPALTQVPENLQPGMTYRLLQGGMQSAAMVEEGDRTVLAEGVVDTPVIPACAPKLDYSLVLEGYLRIPYAHEALFKLGSADGSILQINGQTVIHNDEPHEYAEQIACVKMERGLYHLKLLYTSFRHEGEMKLWGSNPAHEFCDFFPRQLSHI